MLLLEREQNEIKSRSLVWNEMLEMDDPSPLNLELDKIISRYGVQILFFLEDYVKQHNKKEN